MLQKSIKTFFAVFIVAVSVAAILAQKSDLKTITETKKITAEELKSLAAPTDKKPVLINFWATWCGPCHSEFPELVEIDKDYRAKGLNFYVVSVDDFAIIDTRVPEFLESYNSTMPSYLINIRGRKEIAKTVRQIAPKFPDVYPLTLLFDGKGKLVFQKNGRVDAKILRAQIDKVLPKSRK
ncbi:MAG: TlpA family protein disulfide reductase [Pyrinomonadaceae bacterium]